MATATKVQFDLQQQLQTLPDILFVLDPQGTILECVGGKASDLTLSREGLIGKDIARCPFGIGPLFEAALRAAEKGRGPVSIEYTLFCETGPAAFEARISRAPQVGFLAVVRNTTRGPQDFAPRVEELDVGNAVSMWKAAFDATAEGILIVDLDGNYVASNHVFHELWRIPRYMLYRGQERVVAKFALSLVHDPKALLEKVKEIQTTRRGRSVDIMRFKDDRHFECISMPQMIGERVVGRVWSFRDITDRVRAEAQTRHDAYHDTLTGLPNRALFRDRLDQVVGRARRSGLNAAVLLLDLDRFKTINDTLGHAAGDDLLIEVGKRLLSRKREGDTIARLGGDEFVLILSELRHKEDAVIVAEQLIEVLKPPIQIETHDLRVSASIGVAIFPDDGEESAGLLKSADMALYRAKELGRDNYQVFEKKLNERAMERLVLENDLKRAIHDEEFIVHYQPQYDLKSGEMRGVEALVRWKQGKEVVPPAKFIGIAEECGLIVPLGRWVLEQAARTCAEINAKSVLSLRVCVNVSALQIQRPNFANEVSEILQSADLPPKKLVVELTESALMANPEQGSYAMEQLKQMGVGIAMDDFGTGHSSLNHVSVLPISFLKIDRSFVENCAKRKADASILTAIVTMGHALGLKVLAEGVETEEQARVLREQGCDEVQGYLYSRPIQKSKLMKLLGIDEKTP
ncbi:MAG: EAL domain-containing protein [Acidobacteria bacterium]|nr:EAL domain-containing protein [Acidobacteriota bacterium]NIM63763.1 EAL domain-containing protein [Acidobacteriota bacterium]NIO59332.1 EAL domain-containing protein [Acidobacteriota bacterium]NIQ30346.1 EAL domain-containing protein [Acidobacteriota bacterium]NIQ85283.1 EAL domain-containing protein [Acidobacteriota bacterium]